MVDEIQKCRNIDYISKTLSVALSGSYPKVKGAARATADEEEEDTDRHNRTHKHLVYLTTQSECP
jgi:hypothetical protein